MEQHHNKVDSYMEVLGMGPANLVALKLLSCHRHRLEQIEQVHYSGIALPVGNSAESHQKIHNFVVYQ